MSLRPRTPMARVLLLLLWLAPAAIVGAADGGPGFQGHPVQARLIFDADTLAPGDSITAAVLLDMAEHWHTYWTFSGDAGLPAQIRWQLPDGVEAGPLIWPGPTRYTEAGDLTVFGYADQVALLTTLHAAAEADLTSPLHLGAQVSWLVCAEICIPGDTTLTAPLSGVGAGLIDHYRSQVPQPWTSRDARAVSLATTVRATESDLLDVRVRLAPARPGDPLPDLFPLDAGEGTRLVAGLRRVVGDQAEVRFRVLTAASGPRPDSARVVVAYAGSTGETAYRELSLSLQPTAVGVNLLEADFTTASTSRAWWIYLSMAFLGGIILNLMPCVLPVVSLKTMALVTHAGAASGRIRMLGMVFSAGVVATFVLLALAVVAIKATGETIGWGFQFQSPPFVVALASLVFVLGLSLFGVVTIRLPGGGGALGSLADREGLLGSFANGVLATILATPCTAPFLGSALGFAFAQPAAMTIAVFTATGLGMALPYSLLVLRPGWVRLLPRPGAWMERFRQAMGFLLMATALWLLWVLGKQLGMEAVVWTSAFLLCLALAAWIIGQWIDLRSSPRRRRLAWLAATAIVAVAYLRLVQPLFTVPTQIAGGGSDSEGIPFEAQRVEEMIAAGETVFINFTAEWCLTCKVNERTVLEHESVRAAFAAYGVSRVQADWTHRDAEITQFLSAFGRSGVPLYVIFPAGRPEAPIVLPEVITRRIVIDALRRATTQTDST